MAQEDPTEVATVVLPEDGGERGKEQRLWIRIPNPHTTLLLGRHHEGDQAFGHSGLSFETAKSAYFNVMKQTHFQSHGDFSMTTSATMSIYSDGVTRLSSDTATTVASGGPVMISAGTGGGDDKKENKGGTFEVVKNYYGKFQKLTELHDQGFNNFQAIVGIVFGVKSLLGFSWDSAPGLFATLKANAGNLLTAVLALKDVATNAMAINKKAEAEPLLTLHGDKGIKIMSPKEVVALANGGFKVVTGLLSSFEVLTFGADIKGLFKAEIFGGKSAAVEAGYKLELSAAGPAGLSSKMSSVEIIGKKVEIGSQTPVSKYMGWNPAKQKPTTEIAMKAVTEINLNSQDKIEMKATKEIKAVADEKIEHTVKDFHVEITPEHIALKHKGGKPKLAVTDKQILAATGSKQFVKVDESSGLILQYGSEKLSFTEGDCTWKGTSTVTIKASSAIKIG